MTTASETQLSHFGFPGTSSTVAQPAYIFPLFFLSGFPALIYQIAWQRSLFSIYGTNAESVAVVVSAFMLGLGLGSLAGGWISSCTKKLVLLFALVELGTALYGIFSLQLFHVVATHTHGASVLTTGLLSFALVVFPTVLMGSNLPILVAFLVRHWPNMGRSTGRLYFFNTMGSAVACVLSAVVLMRSLGLSGSVRLAATLNAIVGLSVLVLYRRSRSIPPDSANSTMIVPEVTICRRTALGLSVASGFILLGYEILWYRAFNFATGTNPKAFPLMLGMFLTGLSFGALQVARLCRAGVSGERLLKLAGRSMVAGSALGCVVPAAMSAGAVVSEGIAQTLGLIVLLISAALMGTVFPLICHVSVLPDDNAGIGLSRIYLLNIIGSALGSFLVGFVLLDMLSLRQMLWIIALLGVILGAKIWSLSGTTQKRQLFSTGAVALLVMGAASPLLNSLYRNLLNAGTAESHSVRDVVETRSGVIAVTEDLGVYGDGAYDGRFSTDLVHDVNGIVRPYALSLLHPAPKHVLMVGLSSGSWATVIAANPAVESVTIVEINPGYLHLIPKYPQVASLLRNPKVKIVIDDGHRWLYRNPDARFDAIVMNTTHHWRAHASNLLSVEFLQLVRKHLNPGGIHYYNCTDSAEALLTGTTVFPHSVRFDNFLAVSDSPFQLDTARWERTLRQYRIGDKPVLDLSRAEDRDKLKSLVSGVSNAPGSSKEGLTESGVSLRARVNGARLVTDDNMATEWRR